MSRRLMVLAVFGCMAALMLALSGVAQAQTIGVGDTFSLPFGATAGPTESIVVTQTASSGVRFNSATASQGTCNVLPSVLTCDLGTVLAGQQVTGTINFTFTQAGEQTITFGLCGSLTGCFINPPSTFVVTGGGGGGENPPPPPPPPLPQECTVPGAIVGTSGPNVLNGTPGRDVICGLGGNDRIDGKGGNDRIYGHAGADRLFGGAGTDAFQGGDGNDTIDGRDGRGGDRLHGGNGRDRCLGDSKRDIMSVCEVKIR